MRKENALVVLAVLVVLVIGTAGCEEGEDPSSEVAAELQEVGEFFDPDRLLEGALDLGDRSARVECVGATEEERESLFHPRIVRGQVLAPRGELAERRDPLWDRLIPSAHAAPLEGELPVANAEIQLVEVDGIGEPLGEPILKTRSNVVGEFCLRLPDQVEFGPQVMLIALSEDRRLRRPLLHRNDVDIYSQPEALVRLLVEEGISLEDLDIDSYLNLDVIAQTAVDLLAPVTVRPEAGLESLLSRLDREMREDRRLMGALERVYEAAQAER